MDLFTSMAAFVRATEEGSFTAAADELDISAQMVGRHVRYLEQWVGGKLLNKTTRQQCLTEVGSLFYERCKSILAEVEATESATMELLAEPRGRLRIAAPVGFGQARLISLLPQFLDAHPHIQVDLYLTNRLVDVVEEEFDAVIRNITPGDDSLVAKYLLTQTFSLCAAPTYLERHGTPRHPSDLTAHQCLHGNWGPGETWQFLGADGLHNIRVNSRLKINNWPALLLATQLGSGISLQPAYQVREAVARQDLVELLTDYCIPPYDLHLLFPPDRRMTLKLRCFADYLQECLREP